MATLESAPLQIREYCPEDLDVLREIDRSCFPAFMAYSRAEFLFYLRQPGAICKVASTGGRIVGFAIGRMESSVRAAHVITLDVAPDARRQKVGVRLMQALHEEFRGRGARQIALEVETGNDAAQRFYEWLGYRRVGVLRGYYMSRRDAYRMEFEIRD